MGKNAQNGCARQSLKVTVPVGVPGVVEVTFAWNVTACPNTDGFVNKARAVEVLPCTPVPGMLAVTGKKKTLYRKIGGVFPAPIVFGLNCMEKKKEMNGGIA